MKGSGVCNVAFEKFFSRKLNPGEGSECGCRLYGLWRVPVVKWRKKRKRWAEKRTKYQGWTGKEKVPVTDTGYPAENYPAGNGYPAGYLNFIALIG